MAPELWSPADQTVLESSLLIGVKSIDLEHAALVTQLNRLIADPHAHPRSEVFSEAFSRLGQQIAAHFRSEEKTIRSLGMPDHEVAAHVEAHNDILDRYVQLSFDLMEGRAVEQVTTVQMIKGWIVDHLVLYDLRIRDYLPLSAAS